MNKRNFYKIYLILFTFLSSYLFFIEYNVFLTDDDAGFALASIDFDLFSIRPHLPGYFLYVYLIKLLNLITFDSFLSMKIIIISCSVLTSLVLFELFNCFFKNTSSFFITFIIITNPITWLFRVVPESYLFDLLFSSLIFLLFIKKKNFIYFPILIVLLGGIRMSSAFFLFPFYIYICFYYIKKISLFKHVLISNLFGLILFLSWFIPLINSAGGLVEYINLYSSSNPMPKIGTIKNIAAFLFNGITFLFPFLFMTLIVIYYKYSSKLDNQIVMKILIWIIPGLLFFIFGHYSKGYINLIYPGFFLLFFLKFKEVLNKQYILSFLIIIQSLFFLFYPQTPVNIDTYFARQARKSSLLDVTIDRLNDKYLYSRDRIGFQNRLYKSMDKCFEYIESNNLDATIFDCKTSDLTINNLVFRYWGSGFVTEKLFNINQYIYQNKLIYKKVNRLNEDIGSFIFISRKDYRQKFLNDITCSFFETDFHCLYFVIAGYEDEFLKRYEYYFAKW